MATLYERLNYENKDKLEMVSDIYPATYRSIFNSLQKDSYMDLTMSEGLDLCQFILGEYFTFDNLHKLFNYEKTI